MMMMQPAVACPPAIRLTCAARKLEAKDGSHIRAFGATSDPYVVIRNMQNQICGKSNVAMKDLSPKWKPFEVDVAQCGGLNAYVTVQVFDWDKDGKDDLIGEFRVTLAELISKINVEFEVINMKKRGRAFYTNSGKFVVLAAEQLAMASKNAKCVQITLEGKDLDRKDINGKSDPFFVIYGCPKVYNAYGGYWGTSMTKMNAKVGKVINPSKKSKYSGISSSPVLIYKSKAIMKTLNPKWEPFVLESRLCGGPNSPLTIEVYDYDSDGTHDFIGSFRTTLKELIVEGAVFPLINKDKKGLAFYKNSGTIKVVTAAPTAAPTTNELAITQAKITFACSNLASRDVFSKSDPFITISGMNGAQIYRSEEYMNDRNPTFKEILLPVVNCGGLDGALKVVVWDWDSNGKHDVIGECTVTLRELTFYPQNPKWRLVCKKYKDNLGYRNSGFLIVKNLQLVTGTPIANVFTPVAAPMMQQGMQPAMQPTMQPGMMTPGMMTPGMMTPGMMQPGMMMPGMMAPGMMAPGMMAPGMMAPGMMQPGMMQPGMMAPGMMQPGMMQPGMMQPGMMQPGMMAPGMMQPGMTQPGMM